MQVPTEVLDKNPNAEPETHVVEPKTQVEALLPKGEPVEAPLAGNEVSLIRMEWEYPMDYLFPRKKHIQLKGKVGTSGLPRPPVKKYSTRSFNTMKSMFHGYNNDLINIKRSNKKNVYML